MNGNEIMGFVQSSTPPRNLPVIPSSDSICLCRGSQFLSFSSSPVLRSQSFRAQQINVIEKFVVVSAINFMKQKKGSITNIRLRGISFVLYFLVLWLLRFKWDVRLFDNPQESLKIINDYIILQLESS